MQREFTKGMSVQRNSERGDDDAIRIFHGWKFSFPMTGNTSDSKSLLFIQCDTLQTFFMSSDTVYNSTYLIFAVLYRYVQSRKQNNINQEARYIHILLQA